jgi:hypothetical protein
MVKTLACIVFAACVANSGLALAEEQEAEATSTSHKTLSDAELDAITAGGPVFVSIGNPGHANVLNIEPATRFICINCGGAPQDVTTGLVVTPNGKVIAIPGGPHTVP